MVLLQQMTAVNLTTFGDVAEYILRRILKQTVVYFVTDQYNDGSIKSYERERRKKEIGSLLIRVERREQKVPKQWAKFLRDPQNKKELIEFLYKDWSHTSRYVKYFDNKTILYVNVNSDFYKIWLENGKIETAKEPSLATNQEEADTKVFLCVKHSAMVNARSICIATVDTDIAIYSIFFKPYLDVPMFLQIGVGDRKKVVSVSEIYDQVGGDMASALPALHCFTGSDYTSAFHGIGKIKALNLLKKHPEFIPTLSLIGRRFTLDATIFPAIESFVCHLYGLGQCSNTDTARYKKLCSKKKCPEPQKLPPTRDALLCHLKRVNYATAVVKCALQQFPVIPGPNGYGWITEGGELKIQWMLRNPVPETLVDFIACNCKKTKCCQKSCVCVAHGLKCSDLCNCIQCENKSYQANDIFEEESDTESQYDSSDCENSENEIL